MRVLLAIFIVALVATTAAAQESAADILTEVDKVIGGNVDQMMTWECVTEQGGKEQARMTFGARIKGALWRRVDFMAPADLKGMRVLVRGPQEMYIYLPEFRKIRKVASHVKEQGFMGTAWDFDDMSLVTFGAVFSAESVAERGLFWTLSLTRKPDQEFRYDKLEVDIRKDMKQPVEIRYFDVSGVKVKTEKRADFTCGFGACCPRNVEMTDHTRGDLRSRMSLKDWKANQGLADALFTTRALERD
jgi:outer membrane lipoprotein-sorting protein